MKDLLLLKILRLFVEHSYDGIYVREIAKKLKISPFSAKRYADMLMEEGIIREERKGNIRYLMANHESLTFRSIKVSYNVHRIEKAGIIRFLKESVANLSSITLFGSASRGEDDYKSDIDLLIIGKDKMISLRDFESKIGREINLHIFGWAEWKKMLVENKAFYIDIISHGVQLYGERPIVDANKKS